jgi:cytochrome c2
VPELPPDDPVTSRPMAGLVLISVFLLMLTVSWSLYDEFYGLRPWRSYQSEFSKVYSSYLEKQYQQRKAAEQKFYSAPQYQKLLAEVKAAHDAAKARDQEIGQQIDLLDRQRAAMTDAFQNSRGLVGALTYQLEQIDEKNKSSKDSKLKELNDAKAQTYDVAWPVDGGKIEAAKYNYDKLNGLFTSIMSAKASLVAQRGLVDQPEKDATDKLNEYVKEQLPGLAARDLYTLGQSVQKLDVKLRQVNVNPSGASLNNLGGTGLVDRCQSCHLGTDPLIVPVTMTLTKADLGLAKNNDAPYTSHPDPDMMKYHPLEKFGCSPCHGGNGRALDTVEKAHGRYEHWLWPLSYRENFESGCQQCHASDMVTNYAPVLNRAKQLYRQKGCIGCHRFQGFDNQDEQLVSARQMITQLENQKQDDRLQITELNKKGDTATDNEAANRYYTQATNLTVTISGMDAQIESLEQRSHNLLQEIKKVGPDLKEVRMKIHKEWIPYWLKHTHEFRPTTKMPQFRLQDDEIQAIAAYIWQSAITGPELPKQAPGNAARGKELFETRGCEACHSIGEGPDLAGGDFAANLSRIGEKDNYDYLVRWILNPRVRTRPYSPFEKRDLGPEDYAKHGLPFVFDQDHSRSPITATNWSCNK